MKTQIQNTNKLGTAFKVSDNTVSTKHILITSQFIQGEETLSAPSVFIKEDHTAKIRVVEERYFPESWEKPEAVGKEGTLQVTPAMPVFGEPTDIGVSLEVTPSLVRLPKFTGQVHLSGKVKLSKMVDSKISQNELKIEGKPMGNYIIGTATSEATFSLITEQDKTAEIKMTYEGKPLTIKIEAKLVDTGAKPQP